MEEPQMNKAKLVTTVLVGCLIWVAEIAIPRPVGGQQSFDVKAHYAKSEHMIPMRDGVKLFTAVYSPRDGSQKYPILLSRTPYTCAPYGPDAYKETIGPSPLFAIEAYIIVYQDVRGAFMSEGTYVNVRPHRDKKGPKTSTRAAIPMTRSNGW
jgi:predicted acyl esterase